MSVQRKSFSHVKRSTIGDESSMPNSPVFPKYMSVTESSKAKVRKEDATEPPSQRHRTAGRTSFTRTPANHRQPPPTQAPPPRPPSSLSRARPNSQPHSHPRTPTYSHRDALFSATNNTPPPEPPRNPQQSGSSSPDTDRKEDATEPPSQRHRTAGRTSFTRTPANHRQPPPTQAPPPRPPSSLSRARPDSQPHSHPRTPTYGHRDPLFSATNNTPPPEPPHNPQQSGSSSPDTDR
ncbi:formin-like protein 14 [Vicia villosa]|uniref:formin-like protein 14 n=1 Tax=Vicia villosa TaxID=3911 RepID=UPI00273CC6D5|nr:formin-like protein 14 [Vicia villosa]